VEQPTQKVSVVVNERAWFDCILTAEVILPAIRSSLMCSVYGRHLAGLLAALYLDSSQIAMRCE
jgi:hypothetical protein